MSTADANVMVVAGDVAQVSRDALDQAFAVARRVCRTHAKSFHFASLFLPREKRDAAYAIYAFCRLLDDAADAEIPVDCRRATIEAFEHCLNVCYGDAATNPVLAAVSAEASRVMPAFAATIRRYGIPKRLFLDLAAGCRMDLAVNRYATWADLERYCYHVAGVVGLIMCGVFGLTDPAAERRAVEFGNAMQLTNVLRDVREDFARGRIYLPAEDLARFGYAEADLAKGVVDERFRELMRFEIRRARALYARGAAGLRSLADDGSRLTACVMGVIYAGILKAIEVQVYDVFVRRARLTLIGKVLRVPIAVRLSRGSIDPALAFSSSALRDLTCERGSPHR